MKQLGAQSTRANKIGVTRKTTRLSKAQIRRSSKTSSLTLACLLKSIIKGVRSEAPVRWNLTKAEPLAESKAEEMQLIRASAPKHATILNSEVIAGRQVQS